MKGYHLLSKTTKTVQLKLNNQDYRFIILKQQIVEYRIAIKLGFNKIGLVVVHNLPENIIKPDSDAGNSAKDSADAPILANFPRIWNLSLIHI